MTNKQAKLLARAVMKARLETIEALVRETKREISEGASKEKIVDDLLGFENEIAERLKEYA